MNKLSVILVFLAVFLGSMMSAAATSNYQITDVDVNGVDVDDENGSYDGTIVDIKRGDTVYVDLELLGVNDTSRVRVKAEIEGYEYGDLFDQTDYFDVKSGVTYSKHLRLKIPDDLGTEDDYTLEIKVTSQDDSTEFEATVQVSENRHDVKIMDAILRPMVVEAGKTLFVDVRLENLGGYREEDVEVRVSILELGLMDRGYINELATEAEEEADEDLENSGSVSLFLRIPENTKTGKYDVLIEAEYNRGHTVTSGLYAIGVEGKAKETPATAKIATLVSLDTTTQTIPQGEGAVYKVMFTNLGDEPKTYSLEATGTQLWANTRVDPSVVTVQPGESTEMYVYVSVLGNAAAGSHPFTVKIREGTSTIKEVSMDANIVAPTTENALGWSEARKGLELGFVVLLVILVILGIVLVIKKLRGNGIETEEPSVGEGQSYYYYPKY